MLAITSRRCCARMQIGHAPLRHGRAGMQANSVASKFKEAMSPLRLPCQRRLTSLNRP